MGKFIIYNEVSGEIIRIVSCPPKQALIQCQEGEYVIEGDVPCGDYRIVNHQLVPYTQKEKDLKEFEFRKHNFPAAINSDMADMELDKVIDQFFLGLMDVPLWRVKNYSRLRKVFYPPYGELLDAEVKSDKKQKDTYINKCLQVKRRFPK